MGISIDQYIQQIGIHCIRLRGNQVGRVLKHRKKGTKYEYLIRWKEFGQEEDSWEPAENLKQCREVVEQYNRLFLTPQVAGPSSGRTSPSRMPAKTRSRPSRSRSTSKTRDTGKRPSSRSPARSTGKKSSSPARSTSKKSASPARSTSKKSSSPARSTKKSTSTEIVFKKFEQSPALQSRLGRSPVRESLTQRLEVTGGRVRAAKVERSEVVVKRSWASGVSEVKAKSEEDSETKTWFGEKRREMLRKLEDRGHREREEEKEEEEESSEEEEEPEPKPKAKKPAAIEGWSPSTWKLTTYRPPAIIRIRSSDIPIIIFVACLIIIGITFFIEEFF